MKQLVAQIRSFNREITRRVGVLNGSFLGGGLPLGQARLLFEIGHGVSQVRRLRRKLGLDSGYVSRMLRALEKKALIETKVDVDDARVRVAHVTVAGRARLRELGRRSDIGAAAWLAPLSARRQQRLVSAMAEVESLLRASEIEIDRVSSRSEPARWCLGQYFRELEVRFDGGFDPDLAISATADELTRPAGYFFLATMLDEPVGCGALKLTGKGVGEVKRMWVSEQVRGLGVGRRILAEIEAQAQRCDVGLLRLETNRSLTEAQALYRKSGFLEVDAFNEERYAHFWFEKSLDRSSWGSRVQAESEF